MTYRSLFARFGTKKSSSNRRGASRRLRLEGLEERTVLSTLYVVPQGTPLDANHFANYHAAYTAASAGDTIQIEPGAAISSVGQGVTGTRIYSGGQINSISITVDNPEIGAGELVTINGGGGTEETRLVERSMLDNVGGNTLILNQPLTYEHSGSPGATVTTTGTLGIDKSIRIQGDLGAPAPIVSPMEVLTGTSGVSFNNVNSTSFDGLTLDSGSKQTRITNSFLTKVAESIGPGNQGNVLDGNLITGFAIMNGDQNASTADVITNNVFTTTDTFPLFIISNNGALVSGNTFNTAGEVPAIELVNSEHVLIQNNTITLSNTTAASSGILLLNSGLFAGKISVTIANNTITSAGPGTAVVLLKNGTAPDSLAATLLGNDIRMPAGVGVDITGDGTNAGIVNLGDGSPGSPGGNNFRSFTAAGVAQGHYAIWLHNTNAAATVPARLNLWSVADPGTVIKDLGHNTLTGPWHVPPTGTGAIDLGQTQLTADEAYIQTLYHDFLGRTGALSELDGWVAVLTNLSRQGVANGIARSPEALKRVVDSFYAKYLQRAADPGGEGTWIIFLQQGGTEEQLLNNILSSQEYADHVKDIYGGADAGFIQSLYNKLLGRNTSTAEVAAWVAALPSMGRTGVITAFLSGTEYRSDVVGGYYQAFLHEAAPATELSAWVNSPFDLLTIEIAITTSDLYYTTR
jgi:hypothetical protein